MGWYSEVVVPRLVHLVLSREPFRGLRPRALAPAQGRVLELGAGSGLNLPHYGPAVHEVLALEPNAAARRMAQRTRGGARVQFVAGDAHALPLTDASVDAVVSTWTLCSLADPALALAEVRRVLRPGGRFLFLEHGRSPDPRTARWQTRLTPLQRRLAGGCHLDRPIATLVSGAGLEVERLDEFDVLGLSLVGHHFLGSAYAPPGGAP